MRVMDKRARRISRGRRRWWTKRRQRDLLAKVIWIVLLLILVAHFADKLGWG